MIDNTIEKIEARISKASNIDDKRKGELLTLVEDLKSEVNELSKTHSEDAQSIAGFVEVSTHEAIKEKQNPELLDLSLNGLNKTVEEFEASHPRIVEVVNQICMLLSNSGM